MPSRRYIANFVGVDVALLSYFFFWSATSTVRGGVEPAWAPARAAATTNTPAIPPRAQTTSRTSSPSRTRAPRASHGDRLAPARRGVVAASSPGRRRT